jgi:hypothetical protein
VRTVIRPRTEQEDAPPPGLLDSGTDARHPRALVERFLAEHTRPGDLVFDPFAGFGTTLRVASWRRPWPAGLDTPSPLSSACCRPGW